jgi:hypothetical protein
LNQGRRDHRGALRLPTPRSMIPPARDNGPEAVDVSSPSVKPIAKRGPLTEDGGNLDEMAE